MFIKSLIRTSQISLKNWHRRKKCNLVSGSKCLQNYVKICAHASGWVLISTRPWMLKILFSLGLIKFRRVYENFCKIDSSVCWDQVCSTPLWHKIQKSFENTWSCNKRSKCIWLSCRSYHGWNKAMDMFRDIAMKNLK